jgi:hypothetical protein
VLGEHEPTPSLIADAMATQEAMLRCRCSKERRISPC